MVKDRMMQQSLATDSTKQMADFIACTYFMLNEQRHKERKISYEVF